MLCTTFSCSFSLVNLAAWEPNKLFDDPLALGLLKEESCVGVWKFRKFLSFLGGGCWNKSKINGGGWKLLSVLGACGWNKSGRGWNGADGGSMNSSGGEGGKKWRWGWW